MRINELWDNQAIELQAILSASNVDSRNATQAQIVGAAQAFFANKSDNESASIIATARAYSNAFDKLETTK